jgi:hypothetical protein
MAATDKELYEIRGDVADPAGTGLRGVEAGVDLTKTAAAHPQFFWRDRVATTDLYEAGDHRMINFFCPQCGQSLRVESHKKEIRFEPGGPHGGRLSVSEMRCTWPGCGWHARIENNRAVDMT